MRSASLVLSLLALGALPVFAQGIYESYNVPCPSQYEIRYGPDGQAYVVVRKFARRDTGTFFTPGVAGSVTQIRQGGGRVHVTLKAGNGRTFGVWTGGTFTYAGRRFKALGFHGNDFWVSCLKTGRRYTFHR